jgi:sigma-54 dependent transcriptional regulator, acetoin dehydrogenase operon transcriptional activator AcoR
MEYEIASIFTTRNLREKSRKLEKLWSDYLQENRLKSKLRNVVLESWNRCKGYGVKPEQRSTSIVYDDQSITRILNNSNLYKAAMPVLDNLEWQIQHTGYLLTLCDSSGRIVYLNGDRDVLRAAEKMNFVVGADWSEEAAGTNAIGTSLKIGEPIQIFAAEHFCQGVHPWTCSSAPVRDPVTDDPLGVIDLTGQWIDAQPHTLGLVMAGALSIQQQLKEMAMTVRHRLIREYDQACRRWPREACVVVDRGMRVVEGNQQVLDLLNLRSLKDLNNLKAWRKRLSQHFSRPDREQEWIWPEANLIVRSSSIVDSGEQIGLLLHLQRNDVSVRGSVKKDDSAFPAWRGIVGQSPSLRQLIHQCQVVADTSVPVLVSGESGTGKEGFARALHAASMRRQQTFVAMNCGAIPKELVASELFGYASGTFTGGNREGKMGKFEEANGGTLFLDEVGEMPLEAQVHLLRVLQEKEIIRLGSSKPVPVDVRIIAATNRDLEALMREGRFRSDLYYRLNVIELNIPPLRERTEDIPLLLRHYLEHYAEQYKKPVIRGLAADTLSALLRYSWPGNVRELQNAVEYAVLFCEEEEIRLCHFPSALQKALREKGNKSREEEREGDLPPIEKEERRMLLRQLEEAGGNLSEVARQMKIARTTLYRRMKKYRIRT